MHTLAGVRDSRLHVTALVRAADGAKQLESAYPDVKTVLGDLEDTNLIRDLSEAADIVLSSSNP